MKKQKADMIGGIAAVAVGAFFFIQTLQNKQMSFFSTTSDGVPGGGFFPYILCVLIMIMGLGLIVRGALKGNKVFFMIDPEMRENMKLMASTLVAILAFLALWKWLAPILGNSAFYSCVAVLELVLNKFMFKRTWLFSILYAVIFTLFIYLVFGMFFAIQFNA